MQHTMNGSAPEAAVQVARVSLSPTQKLLKNASLTHNRKLPSLLRIPCTKRRSGLFVGFPYILNRPCSFEQLNAKLHTVAFCSHLVAYPWKAISSVVVSCPGVNLTACGFLLVQALEAMILFLVGSGVDVNAVRASIRALEETQYISPFTTAGHQQQQLNSMKSKTERYSVGDTSSPVPMRASSQGSRPASPTDPGSQQLTPRCPPSAGASEHENAPELRLAASPTNPFNSD